MMGLLLTSPQIGKVQHRFPELVRLQRIRIIEWEEEAEEKDDAVTLISSTLPLVSS